MDDDLERDSSLEEDEVDLSDVKLCAECETEFSGEGELCSSCERDANSENME